LHSPDSAAPLIHANGQTAPFAESRSAEIEHGCQSGFIHFVIETGREG
jgi:hypothetical protein